jgi:hypothetical protein
MTLTAFSADTGAPAGPKRENLMPTKQTDSHGAGSEDQGARVRDSLIGQHVIRALGSPEGLFGVQIRPLWGLCFRVNVLVGADAASARVRHSYFLTTDGLGKVVASSPTILRQYGVDEGTPAPAVTASTTDEGGRDG